MLFASISKALKGAPLVRPYLPVLKYAKRKDANALA